MRVPKELPPKYYLTYFKYMLELVQRLYGGMLSSFELSFIRSFTNLTEEAQCLYLRMANRKGKYFNLFSFNYEECGDTLKSFDELQTAGFARMVARFEGEDTRIFLDKLTKEVLVHRLLDGDREAKKLRKKELVDLALYSLSEAEIVQKVQEFDFWVEQQHLQELNMLYYFFFGNTEDNLTAFVLNDVYGDSFAEFEDNHVVAQFSSRQEALDRLWIHETYQEFRIIRETNNPENWLNWISERQIIRSGVEGQAKPVYDRLIGKLGRMLERSKLPEEAERLYQCSDSHPSRERLTRLYYKKKDFDRVEEMCLKILEQPTNPEEKTFAEDFLKRITETKRVKSLTRKYLQETAIRLELPVVEDKKVEHQVLDHYAEEGYQGFFSENHTWRTLFGYLFWEILEDNNYDAHHHPLQKLPSDIYKPEFFERRKEAFEEQVEQIERTDFVDFVLDIHNKNHNKLNPFINWHYGRNLDQVFAFMNYLPKPAVKQVLMDIAKNPMHQLKGLPDLFVHKDGQGRFCEVKSPNDQLSNRQLHWIKRLNQVGIPCEVVWVDFTDYSEVLVDLT